MRELSLFSGAGGGLLGSLLLGWKPIGYVEFNDYCQRVIAQRIADGILPVAPIFGDIRTFISEGYAAAYQGMVDVISGGFPCQPFSVAGKRAGADDERNMWPATIDTVRAVRPRYCFFENVPGLLTSGYFERILCDLTESGYSVRWRCLSAAELGAPHKRDRLWIVGYTSCDGRREGWHVDTEHDGHVINTAGQHTAALAHAEGKQATRVQQHGIPANAGAGCQMGNTGSQGLSKPKQEWKHGRSIAESSWWETEPRLGRLADGVPNRINRLKAAGNAQVPIVAATAWRLLTEDLCE